MYILIKEAVKLLKNGAVVGVPTETVYGLAASLEHPQAIQEIYQLKGRPSNNPLIIHLALWEHIVPFLQDDVGDLMILAKNFWPGPMTLVLPIKPAMIPAAARANLPTAAFRIPQHPLALELLQQTGPLVMPSANLSGRPSSTQPQHVENDFGRNFPVLDGGICDKGMESTILIQHHGHWEIIRQGALVPEYFKSTLGYLPLIRSKIENDKPLCPGQLYRHYAPKAKLKLVEIFDNVNEGVIIGFSDRTYPQNCQVLTWGPLTKPETVVANLYAVLRQLDQAGHSAAYVDIHFPSEGILATLTERLHKAASNT